MIRSILCGLLGLISVATVGALPLACQSGGNYSSNCKGLVMKLFNQIKTFLKSEDGPTAVEYAVMLALIVIVCLTAIQAVGTNAAAKFNSAATALK